MATRSRCRPGICATAAPGCTRALDDLGFCDLLGQDLRATAREYAEMQRAGGVFKGRMTQERAMA